MSRSGVADLSANLMHHVQNVLQDLPALSGEVDPSDIVTKYLLNRLLVATDYALGCTVLAQSALGPPMVPLTRVLFESFVSSYWATLTKENGEVIVRSMPKELIRITKLNLEKGHARIKHKETGEDHTGNLLGDPKMASPGRLPRYDHMADGAGVRRIYDQL